MKTFQRYFIHMGGICLMAMCIFCILLFIDKSPLLQPVFVLVMWFCVLLFSVPMALLFASWEKIEIIKFGKLKESDVEKLDSIICNKYKRKRTYETENRIEYGMENKYKSWLTNAIVIEKKEDSYYLKIPKVYASEIRNTFNEIR